MDVKLLKSDILTNNIPNFLIFIEEEPALSKQYLTYMSSTLNKAIKFYDSADAVIYDVTTNMKDDYLYIVFNDQNVIKNPSYVTNLVALNRNIVVCFSSMDKADLFYKTNKSYIVVFEKLDTNSLLAYAQKLCKNHKVTIEQSKLFTLISYCDNNLGILLSELDKIFIMEQDNSNVLVDYMMRNGFPDYRKTNIFEYINKVLSKKTDAFSDLLKLTDSPVSIVYNMYNTARKRLIDTKNPFYGNIMSYCYKIYSGIIDGTMSDKYAIRYLMLLVYSGS